MPSMSSTTTLKLPEFQTTSPATWLLLCESTFVIKKVSKISEKFHHVVAALPASVAILLRDVLTMRPTVGPDGVEVDHRWELLQERLKAMYSLNDFEAFQRVADYPNLQSAQKPSQLLSAMTALVPEGVTPCPLGCVDFSSYLQNLFFFEWGVKKICKIHWGTRMYSSFYS